MTTTVLPTQVHYGRVRGKLLKAAIDSEDIDLNPDSVPAVGTLTFTPEISGLLTYDTLDMTAIIPEAIVVELDDQGAFDEYLVATDNSNPDGWTYRVDFNVIGVSVPSISIAIPSGSDNKITDWLPLASSGGNLTIRGPRGFQGDSAYQVWLAAGNTGTVNDYLASLKGSRGDPGSGGGSTIEPDPDDPSYYLPDASGYRLVAVPETTGFLPPDVNLLSSQVVGLDEFETTLLTALDTKVSDDDLAPAVAAGVYDEMSIPSSVTRTILDEIYLRVVGGQIVQGSIPAPLTYVVKVTQAVYDAGPVLDNTIYVIV